MYVREDMFENPECRWIYGPINRLAHTPFARTHHTFRIISHLARLRRAHAPIFESADRLCAVAEHPATIVEMYHRQDGAQLQRLLVLVNPDLHQTARLGAHARTIMPERCHIFDPMSGASSFGSAPTSLPPLSFLVVAAHPLTVASPYQSAHSL